MPPDGLVVLLAAAQIERGDVLNQALYRTVGDGVVQNRALDDGAIQGLDVFPAEDSGFGCPVAGVDDELTVFRAHLFGFCPVVLGKAGLITGLPEVGVKLC
jgi:hypothetical protein